MPEFQIFSIFLPRGSDGRLNKQGRRLISWRRAEETRREDRSPWKVKSLPGVGALKSKPQHVDVGFGSVEASGLRVS